MNPISAANLDDLSYKQQHAYLNNRVGRYLNITRPNGTETELGNFYFARNPNHLVGFKKSAEALFGIKVDTGLATCYPNNSQVPSHDRLSVRSNMHKLTLTRDGTFFIKADQFVNLFPNSNAHPGSTYDMTLSELALLPTPSFLDNITAVFSVTLTGLAT